MGIFDSLFQSSRPPTPMTDAVLAGPPPQPLPIDAFNPPLQARDEAALKTYAGALPTPGVRFATPEEAKLSDVPADVATSFVSGVDRGALQLLGFPGDVQRSWNSIWDRAALGGAHKIMDLTGYGPQADTTERKDFDRMWNVFNAVGEAAAGPQNLPTGNDMIKGFESWAGKLPEPKTLPGQYVGSIGSFIPGAGRNLITGGVIPAILSETAGQATMGTKLEPWARLGGGLAGAGAAGSLAPHAPLAAIEGVEAATAPGLYRPAAAEKLMADKPPLASERATASAPVAPTGNYPENVLPEDFLRRGAPEPTWDETLRAMRNQHEASLSPPTSSGDARWGLFDPLGGMAREPDKPSLEDVLGQIRNIIASGEPTTQAGPFQNYNRSPATTAAAPTLSPGQQALVPGIKNTFSGYGDAHEALAKHLDAIGMDGPAFAQAMFGDNHSGALVTHFGDGRVKLSAMPVPGSVMERTLDPAGGIASHDYFEVPKDAQGTNIGKQLLRSQIDTYEPLGIHTVNVHANIDVGGYAWARYGFVPDKSSWDYLRQSALPKLDEVKGQLAPDTYKDARALLESTDPKSMWKLVDKKASVAAKGNQNPTGGTLPHDMSDEDVNWQGTLAKLRAQTEAGTPGLPVPGFQWPTRANPPGAPLQGETTTLGKHLFLGSNWMGKLDLRDPETVNRFNEYVSRAGRGQ